MAIIIEENKKGFGLLNTLMWLIVIIVISFATYYIFFKKPEVIGEFIPPKDIFENIDQLSTITLDPEIIKNPAFQSLTSYITVPVSGRAGRPNPFLPL